MNIKINNNHFIVKTMLTPSHTQQGMMNKNFDKTFNGMLFLMDDGEHCFWMKNCITPLDIIFIKNNKILKIHHNCQPCNSGECQNYCGDGDLVLEIKGGSCKEMGIEIGNSIEF